MSAPGARNVVLIGLRGCGKTSVGPLLAQRWNWHFTDTDALIAAQQQRTIADIISTDGEPAFRLLEADVIADVVRGDQQVISVGGGAVGGQRNRDLLHAAGICVWLTAPPETLLARIQADPQSAHQRPPLRAAGGLAEVRALLQERQPLYSSLAGHTINTVGLSVEQVADAVAAACSTNPT